MKQKYARSKLHQNIVWKSNNVTFLGITVEHNLESQKSVSNICLKVNRKLSTPARVAKLFPFKSKCLFLKATIESQFK